MSDLKILVVGPKRSGKSAIANLLAGPDSPEGMRIAGIPYDETAGCRILEFDFSAERGSSNKIPIELWDCSGDLMYESCWPAIKQGAKGVVLVFNPENAAQASEMNQWFDWFVLKGGLQPEQCLVLANECEPCNDDMTSPRPRSMDDVQFVTVGANSQHEITRSFRSLVRAVVGNAGRDSGSGKDDEP